MTSDLSLLSMLPTLLRTIPAVQQGMKGVNLGPSAQTVSNINQLSQAETNQNSPLFQSMLMQNKQQGQSNLADTIAQIQAQNRLATSSGQSPLLSQERGSEGIFRNLIQGQQAVGNQAVAQTYGQIQQAQQGLNSSLGAQNGLANAQYANTQKKTAAYGTIGDALQGIFGLGNKQNQSQSQPETINWNQGGNSTIGTPQNYTMPNYNYNTSNPNNSNYTSPVQKLSLLPQNNGSIANGNYQ